MIYLVDQLYDLRLQYRASRGISGETSRREDDRRRFSAIAMISHHHSLPTMFLPFSAVGRILCVSWFTVYGRTRRREDLSVCSTTALTDGSCHGLSSRVCVVTGDSHTSAAVDIAKRLNLPIWKDDDPTDFSHALCFVDYDLEGGTFDYAVGIKEVSPRASSRSKRQERDNRLLIVDFCPSPSSRVQQRSKGSTGPDLLLKAVGPRKGFSDGARILDLTAGLGQDSLLMSMGGAQHVTMVERDPVVAFLLHDALRRLQLEAEHAANAERRDFAMNLAPRLALVNGEGPKVASGLLSSPESLPDIVYLDPMFPARTKKASVKKNMQILHSLLDSQEIDAATRQHEEAVLLEAALAVAQARVVVKRPVNAPVLDGIRKPSYEIRGSVNRWDVYVQ